MFLCRLKSADAVPSTQIYSVIVDLTYAEGGHNWRSIVFSLLVIGFVIAGIVTAIYLLGYVDELLYWSGRRLTLDECLRDDLTPHRLPPTWVSHDKFVYQADDGSLTLLDTSNNTVSLLVSNHTLVQAAERPRLPMQRRFALRIVQAQCQAGKQLKSKNFLIFASLYSKTLSPLTTQSTTLRTNRPVIDSSHSLLRIRFSMFSRKARCKVRKTSSVKRDRQNWPNHFRSVTSFRPNRQMAGLTPWHGALTLYHHHTPLRLHASSKVQQTRLQHATWLGNTTGLVMISENDIYLRIAPSAMEDTQLTDTGVPGIIYNGVPDWLYQEEVLPRPEATWPSPDGTHILFASFNDTKVTALEFPWFGTQSGQEGSASTPLGAPRRGSFPPSRSVRYPTPGSANPEVDLWLLEVNSTNNLTNGNGTTGPWGSTKTKLKPPPVLEGQEYYLISAGWVGGDASQIAVVWMTRSQNLSLVSACRAPLWECEETHTERAPEGQWLDAQPHPIFAPDGDSFLLLAAVQEGDKEHFTHIKHVTLTQQRIAVLSHGRYEVSEILAWDTKAHLVYYLGTRERRPGQKHLYVVRDPIADDPRRLEPLCVTCDLGEVLWSSRQANLRFLRRRSCTSNDLNIQADLLD
ncbi:dipeptidyl aminopeptidase-like protein 6 isoform X1 [Vespula squamosa]|uniref:Dipeptidyl aminopeptidase-like protein 6 isoform X1 n=1 Tax=Vespula squamosa TaxID=30214 RepID=A0ABD2BVY0_VESSQ